MSQDTHARTTWTHDLPANLDALLTRLRSCDGVNSDATVIVWEKCQALVAEMDRMREENVCCRLALESIACFEDESGSFDEPHAAGKARDALAGAGEKP